MSWRELKSLINGLPPNSLFKSKLAGSVTLDMWQSGWTSTDMLLALLTDWTQNIAGSSWMQVTGKPPPWNADKVRIIRPGEKRSEPEKAIDQNALAILERFNKTGSKSKLLKPADVTIDPDKVMFTEGTQTTT